jgi:ribosomal-protein-alanine N-acetyltransferase
MSTAQAPTGQPPAQIRALTSDDLDTVCRIENASYSVPWSKATFRSLLFRTDTDLICAESGGTVIGYAVCWYVLDQAELGNVAVDEAWRGQGIGGLLIDSVLERAQHRRAREIFLEVRRTNLIAQRLYRRIGFRDIGVRRNYYVRPTEDAIVMRYQLRGF